MNPIDVDTLRDWLERTIRPERGLHVLQRRFAGARELHREAAPLPHVVSMSEVWGLPRNC